MANLQDPFYVVKEELVEELQAVSEMYDKWKDLLENSNTSTNEDFKYINGELKTLIQGIEDDLKALEETISVVETDKIRFRIEESEIVNRKSFVVSTKKRIQLIKEDMISTKTRGKIERDSRSVLMQQQGNGKFSRLENAIIQDNEEFIQGQHKKHEQIFEEQDIGLDKLHGTVVTLRDMASTINTTLDEHNHLISGMEKETDKADSRLKGAVKKVNQLIDSTKDGTQIAVIVVLILLLIGLIILVFYI